jgi:hypothetical protein
MNTPNLLTYIQQQNVWEALSKRKTFDINTLTVADRNRLQQQLDCDLSPENLCCDGELRGLPLQRKTRFLMAVQRELLVVVCQ